MKYGFFVYYLFLLVVVSPFLPEHWSNDTKSLFEIYEGFRDQDLDSGSYYYTALLFGALGSASYIFIAGVGGLITQFYSKVVVTRLGLYMGALLATPAFLLGLVRPQKEVFVFVLTYFVCKGIERYRLIEWKDFLFVAAVYVIYAAMMRPYYAIIPIVFAGLLIARRYGLYGYMTLILLGLFSIAIVPNEILVTIQGSRDEINMLGRAVDENQRTAFTNIFTSIDGVFEFVANYINAFLILNLSFIYFFDIPSLVLCGYMGLCIFFVLKVKECDPYWERRAYLFAAHMIVLPLFEPDVGSYFRHISSVFLYLAGAVAVCEKIWRGDGKERK